MFFKKKDKAEPAKADAKPAAPAAREEPRREERRPEPPRAAAPAPQPAAAPRPASQPAPAGKGPGGVIDAALNAARGPKGAPVSIESLIAQARAADRLAQSSDPTDQQAAKALAAGQIEQGFNALQQAADAFYKAGNANAPNAWRTLGALAFNVAAGRSKLAYEHLFNFQPRQFWDCIFLARLRGIGGQMPEAHEAASAAVAVASDDVERGLARAELGLIALASNDAAQALQHAEESIAMARRAGAGPSGQRDLIGRLVLLGDAALATSETARARAAFVEALALVRKDGQAAPTDTTVARAVCEVLEKCAAAHASEPAVSAKYIDEAVTLRRRIQPALSATEGKRGLAHTLTLKAELARTGGDQAGAKAAFEESLALARQLGEADPKNASAQREVWVAMWRMAVANAGMDWRQVASAMERIDSAGGLDEDGKRFLGEAKRRAAA